MANQSEANLSTNDKLAAAQWVFERTLGWIAAAEIKIGIVLTIDFAMMGALAAAFSAATVKTTWIYFLVSISAIWAVFAVICSALSLAPRLDGPTQSLLYFGRIAEIPRGDFIERFKKSSLEDLLTDWTEQIHRNAEIAKSKHIWVKHALIWSFLSTIPWAVAIALLVRG